MNTCFFDVVCDDAEFQHNQMPGHRLRGCQGTLCAEVHNTPGVYRPGIIIPRYRLWVCNTCGCTYNDDQIKQVCDEMDAEHSIERWQYSQDYPDSYTDLMY